MSAADLLHTAEREPDDRPVRVAAPLPDIEPTSIPWTGSATSHVERWRGRALRAEAHVEQLQRALVRHRLVP